MKAKEMIYQYDRKVELLFNDIFKGYHYYILSLGTHPTAYIEIPKTSFLYKKDYDEISNIEVHGGFTYGREYLYISENTKMNDSWFIGWDYAHLDDYVDNYFPIFEDRGKKWTTEEIIKECQSVINQIIDKVGESDE